MIIIYSRNLFSFNFLKLPKTRQRRIKGCKIEGLCPHKPVFDITFKKVKIEI